MENAVALRFRLALGIALRHAAALMLAASRLPPPTQDRISNKNETV